MDDTRLKKDDSMDDTRFEEGMRALPERWDRRDALKVGAGSALGLVGMAAAAGSALAKAMPGHRPAVDVVTSATPAPPSKCKHDKDCPSGQRCKHKKHRQGHCT